MMTEPDTMLAHGLICGIREDEYGELMQLVCEDFEAGKLSRAVAWRMLELIFSCHHEQLYRAYDYDPRAIAALFERFAPPLPSLASSVTLYRGVSTLDPRAAHGVSWTTSPATARFFLHYSRDNAWRCPARWRHMIHPIGAIYRIEALRSHIAAVITDRDEHEYVLNRAVPP